MTEKHEIYPIEIASVRRELPLFEVAPGMHIAVLNILGDVELVQACANALSERLDPDSYDVLVTAEAKSIPLIYALALETGKPYVVLRKTYKPYMGVALSAETRSITTGKPQMLYLDEKDHDLVRGKRIALLDDVISTGSTQNGMRRVIEMAGADVTIEAAIFTEGDSEKWQHIIALGHLPVFMD
ncbi:MAG: phosphoribosyltransferase family protein [Anaerolineales bacterium]